MTSRTWNQTFEDPTVSFYPREFEWDMGSQSGNNTPYFLRKQGVWQDNAYSMERSRMQDRVITVEYAAFPSLTYRVVGRFTGAAPGFEPCPYPDTHAAISRLSEKWRGSEFDAGVTIGEGRESAKMIVERLTSIAQSARALKKGDLRSALSFLAKVPKSAKRRARAHIAANRLGDAYLELELGWMPLVRDIYALAEHVKVKPRRNIVRTSLTTKAGLVPQYGFPPEDVFGLNQRRLYLQVEVSQPPSEIERLGLNRPLNIAWNLTGLSFLVDWFLPMASTLDFWHALTSLPVKSCVMSEIYERKAFCKIRAGTVYNSTWVPRSSHWYTSDQVRMDRFVSSSPFALWGIAATTPAKVTPKWDGDLRKMAIAVALATQRLLRL